MLSYREMAKLLKCNVLSAFPDDLLIGDELKNGLHEPDIPNGLKGFSALLIQLFDVLIENSDAIAPPGADLEVFGWPEKIYADLHNPFAMLYSIGLCGKYDENLGCLQVDGKELNMTYKKSRGSKGNKNLQLLQDSGLTFSADLEAKSFSLNKAGIIQVHYPDNKSALIGLKAIADATALVKGAQIIAHFARCDYRLLALPKKYTFDIGEVTKFLPSEHKNFFIELHDFAISNNCKLETKPDAYIFNYTSKIKKTKVFSIHVQMNGSYVKINSKLIDKQPDLLNDAPKSIKEAVKKGHGCAKKSDPDACNPKCIGRNLKFSLDQVEYLKCGHLNFNLPISESDEREYVKKWLAKELE